jgi:hypothetical protein
MILQFVLSTVRAVYKCAEITEIIASSEEPNIKKFLTDYRTGKCRDVHLKSNKIFLKEFLGKD